jgi:hypothetical protein
MLHRLPHPIDASLGQKILVFGSHGRHQVSIWCDPTEGAQYPGSHVTYERGSMYRYRIGGLHVSSQLELPGAIPEASRAEATDVTIRLATVPVTLEGAATSSPAWEIAGEKFLLRVPRLARFLIARGQKIDVKLEPDAKERDATGFLLGTSFGILLHQRGALVLHGAAVASGGRSIAICGVSGAGKSTLAAALCREGCSFVADDICVISLNGQREPIVQSDGRQLKLWQESIDKLDLSERRGEAVRDTFEKYFIQPFDRIAEPPKLSAIYVLRWAHSPLQASIESLALPDAIRMLEYEAYRPELRAKMGCQSEILAQAAAVFGHAKAFLLIRPGGFEHMEETVAILRKHWDALDR